MPTRRDLIASAAGLPTLLSGANATGGTLPTGPAPWWLLDPLAVGSRIGGGWRIDKLSPVVDGGAILTLSDGAMRLMRIHICLHDGKPRGFAYTSLFDLVVMDQGRGVRLVPPEDQDALRQLGQTIAFNELNSPETIDGIAGMMTHRDRVAAFGASNLN